MKNRIISVIVVMLFASFLLSVAKYYDSETEQETKVISLEEITYQFKPEEVAEIIKPTPSPTYTPDPYDVARYEMQKRVSEINSIEDKQEWFVTYKEITNEYEEWIDPPKTIYDVFSDEELDLLFRVVQAEVGDEWDFIHKVNVANVVFNRLYSDECGFKNQDTLSKVLVAKQFTSISDGRYREVEVSEVTILACEYAYMVDTTDGCIAFRSDDNPPKVWNGWNRIFGDDAHYFYK